MPNGPTVSGSFADPALADVVFSLLDATRAVLLGPLAATNLGGGNYGYAPAYPAGYQYGFARWGSATAGLTYDYPLNLPAAIGAPPPGGGPPAPGAVLALSPATIRRLCGIDAADTTQDAAIALVVTGEQAVIEYQITPAALASTDGGLIATLVLGVSEILAGRYLQQTARAPGALDDLRLGSLTLTAGAKPGLVALAQQLAAHGAARIAPWGYAPGVPPAFVTAKSTAAAQALLPSADLLGRPPDSDGLSGSTGGVGLFGTLQGAALGTDDGDPPAAFSDGYTSLSDPDQLGGE